MSDRMKGMKLGNFSGIKKPSAEPSKPAEPETIVEAETEPAPKPKAESKAKTKTKKTDPKPAKTTKSKAKVDKKNQAKELVTVNIKIRKDQKEWLTDTASTVRNNNSEPVAPSERVYPQHLIGVAIDLLQNFDVDWTEVKNVEELKEHLNL
ncbi:MAG: hypothetical protein AAGE84_29640 [Cyanobacteria bacterium P01_G01_bin.39]